MGLREEKKLKTKTMILNKSMHLFNEKGVDNVGMRELAQICDLGIGTYYNYFQSKDEVVISLIEGLIKQFKEKNSTGQASLLDLAKYLAESRNLLSAFVPIALKTENIDHVKSIKKSLVFFRPEADIDELFYGFINLGHYLLISNELDSKLFYSKMFRN